MADFDDQTVLLLGTLGGGGIHHYIESLDTHLGDSIDARIYDMHSDPTGSGVVWLVRSVIGSAIALFTFPFQRRPDIVHAHTSQGYSFYRVLPYILFVSIVWRRPVILHIHGSSFDQFLRSSKRSVKLLQSLAFAHIDHLIVLSDYWAEVFQSEGYEGTISAIPNAVDEDAFVPQFDVEVPRVVFISNLVERKGVIEFVEVVDELIHEVEQPFTVTIAGDGPLRSIADELATTTEAISYLGYITEPEKRTLLSESSIFVLPTHAEGLPFALLEGMAGGNAVVSTPVGSIPEVVDEAGGALVKPGDTASLRRELRRLICSPSAVSDMGRHNRAVVEERYSWDAVTDSVQSVYQSVLLDEHDAQPDAAAHPGPG